ncbi:MAG: N-formylglutamate amidohydrolase [Sphaerochaeta sp.]|nr:N-formylglutamate amidohydrolase [Sphaerochaeta sp.]
MKTPLLLHIPHSSLTIPKPVREKLCISDAELELELLRMTDRYTDILFDLPTIGTHSIVYPVSRLVVDPERFEDDAQEPMAAVGMGVIYTATSQKTLLRTKPDACERTELLDAYYRPHHRRFTEAVAELLNKAGQVLIIDCHSFPSRPWSYELNQEDDRPDICLGTDPFPTPQWLLEALREAFQNLGYIVAVDHPFAGTIVPLFYYTLDPRVLSIMIEVNRKLYMHEATGEKGLFFPTVKADITTVVTQVLDTCTIRGCL